MKKNDDILSHTESFHIIEQMIAAAKNEHREKGDGWLIWGWLLFISSVVSALLVAIDKRQFIGWVWTGLLFVGLLVYFGFSRRKRNKSEVVSYIEELLNKFGAGFFISLFVMIFAANISGNSFSFGYYYILYAFWMFIHGSAIRFRPLIIGAVVNWMAAIAIFLTKDLLLIMVISSVAILVGYLIPGYMLRSQFNRNYKHQQNKVA